jgi:hypothetical protein
MMDADEDGSHIKGLIINFLSYFFPSLLEIDGFLKILVTPIVKVFLKDKTLNFSNLRSYNTWITKNPGNYKIKYYKGLGTSTATEAKEYFSNLENNTIKIINKNNDDDILLAFAKEKISDRKVWLTNYDPNNILEIDPPTTITIKQFINQELIHFSNYDNIRSIPSLLEDIAWVPILIVFPDTHRLFQARVELPKLPVLLALGSKSPVITPPELTVIFPIVVVPEVDRFAPVIVPVAVIISVPMLPRFALPEALNVPAMFAPVPVITNVVLLPDVKLMLPL